jgi:aminodeoxyfutalosine deaminase
VGKQRATETTGAAAAERDRPATFPKIELHVHLEATVQPATLLAVARRNGYRLPADTVEGLAELCRFRDFLNFLNVWVAITPALQTADDFRRVVVDYAREAAARGAVYIEAIFSPAEPVVRGIAWQEVFEGYCDGAQEARERLGIEVNLTPDITRTFSLSLAEETVRWCGRFRERGVVAVGLGGLENPPEQFSDVFALARSLGLGSVPHAGEGAGPASVRAALDALRADRIRHGIRAVEDPALVAELVARGTVLDVTPVSNLRTRVVPSLRRHPLRALRAAGVRCSISTDDPALFATDLDLDYAVAAHLGVEPRWAYESGVAGALCAPATRERLRVIGDRFDWATVPPPPADLRTRLKG